MKNKKFVIIIGIILIAIGARSLFNSTYTTTIGGGDTPTSIFISIDNQSLIIMIILLITFILGIIFSSKAYGRKSRNK